MSIVRLQSAIAKRVEDDIARLWGLQTPSGGRRAPRVGVGLLPTKGARSTDEDPPDNPGAVSDDYPYVQVVPGRGGDGEDGTDPESTATVYLAIGTYSDDPAGHTDVLLVIDLLRQSLGEQPMLSAPHDGTGRMDPSGAAGQYIGQLKRLDWTLPIEQPRPYWVGTITTTWTIPRPVRVDGVRAR